MGASMKRLLLVSISTGFLSASLLGQAPPQSAPAPSTPPAQPSAGGQGAGATANPPTGRLPWIATVDGKPIDTRPTEKKDNAPAFPQQTRAPYRATAPFKVTTLIDNIQAPWSLAFLPKNKIILTERLPGRLRILDASGKLSEPITGVSVVSTPGARDMGLLDVVLHPNYASNHTIFFSFFDFIDNTDSNTYVARATLDEEKLALSDVTVIYRSKPAMP